MRQFLSVVAFTLLTIGFFAGYSNYGIPQIEPAPPPVEEKLDLEAMTMDQFIALGERLFKGKGTCTLCHNELGRAPMLNTAVEVAPKRMKDARYEGEASNVEEYLVESLIEPSAFVVAGFGKKGTNDKESPMPNVAGGSIGLSEAEITAVVAYLQDLGGGEVTVEIPSGAPPAEAEDEDGEPREPFETVKQMVEAFQCGACHKLPGTEGEVGPPLMKVGARMDRAALRTSILDPNAEIAKGFERDQMPPDYGNQMYVKELEMLLDYLVALK